jgi:hypothetical protein
MALASVIALSGVVLFSGNVSATTPVPGVTTTILAKSTFAKLNIRAEAGPDDLWSARLKTHGTSDSYVVDNKFAPGSDTGWHSHPGPSLVFVVAGTVTDRSAQVDDGQSRARAACSVVVLQGRPQGGPTGGRDSA